MRFKLLLILSIFLTTGLARAAESIAETAKASDDIDQRAKQRVYPGGRDEADLRVQNPLPVPTRKLTPTLDDEKADPSDD